LHVRLPDRDRPSGDHFNGTYVPVEEPSTASGTDSGRKHPIQSPHRRTMTEAGILMPSGFAVLRLMTNRNLVDLTRGHGEIPERSDLF
jgi:hypothetical protein